MTAAKNAEELRRGLAALGIAADGALWGINVRFRADGAHVWVYGLDKWGGPETQAEIVFPAAKPQLRTVTGTVVSRRPAEFQTGMTDEVLDELDSHDWAETRRGAGRRRHLVPNARLTTPQAVCGLLPIVTARMAGVGDDGWIVADVRRTKACPRCLAWDRKRITAAEPAEQEG